MKKQHWSNTMKYLPESLKREYEYFIKNNPDIDGLEHPLINLSDDFRAYFILVHYFTDVSTDEEQEQMMVGIRSIDLLASALGRQNISFGGKRKYTNALDICATLFFGIVKNHSFNDGNKRTALLLLLYQLQLFGYYPTARQSQFEKLVLCVAEGSIELQYWSVYKKFKKHEDPVIHTISFLLKQMTQKKNNAYNINPTMREFCSALEAQGVTCCSENGKMKFSFVDRGKWRIFMPKEQKYSIPFHGWTRIVGAKTARDTLNALGLYDQFPTYKHVLEKSDPLYTLVDIFKEPLRRLKDK